MSETKDVKEGKLRDFVEVLEDIDDSRLVQQLTQELAKLVRSVRETNKAGSLSLTLTAKLERGTMIVLSPKVKTTLPAPAIGPTLFYSDEVGNTTRNDPKQMNLKVVVPMKVNT